MPFLFGLILLLVLVVSISYGLRYLIDYLIIKTPEELAENEHYRRKHPLANIPNNRITVLAVGGILSLTFSYFVINYKTYELVLEDPNPKKDTLYVDPLVQIEITEHKKRPQPKKKITTEVKETPKPIIDTNLVFEPEPEIEPETFQIPTDTYVKAEPVNTEPVLRAEKYPHFQDSDIDFRRDPNFLKYVSQEFNKNKIREGETGVIYVSFVIEKDGKITNVKIERGLNERLDNEVLRVIKTIPDFTSPAMNNGMPVRLLFNWPFRIK